MKNTYLNELSLTSICLFCENADENGIISVNCTQCYPNKLKFVMGDNKWTKERAEMIVNRAKSSKEKLNFQCFQCWKCGRILPISERTDSAYMSNPPKYACKECEGIKPENPTIEQNAGENRIEGGVLSLSVAPKELNEHCKGCKGKGCDCGNCSNKDEENSYYLLHKEKFSEQKENHYRPFEDTTELMLHYKKHFNIDFPPFYEPIIWVKNKHDDKRFLIIGYDELTVDIGISKFTMKDLFRQCVFLDSSPIGQEE